MQKETDPRMCKVDPFSPSSKTLQNAFVNLFEETRRRRKGVIIASSQRCGTHLLGAYLGAVDIGSPGEHFLDYLNNRTDDLGNGRQLADALNQIHLAGSGGLSDAFSVVLMGYTQKLTDDLDAVGLASSLLPRSLKHLPWVWLRRDAVDVAISHYFAVCTGYWESKAGQHSAPPFDARKIRRWWQHLREVDAYWEGFFRKHGIQPLELDYAQLVRDRSVLLPVIEQAGGDPDRLVAAEPPARMPHAQIKEEYAFRFRDLLAEQRSAQLINAQSLAGRRHGTN